MMYNRDLLTIELALLNICGRVLLFRQPSEKPLTIPYDPVMSFSAN